MATTRYFPLETAIVVTKTAITSIEAYSEFENDISHLKIYFQINLSNLYIEDRRFEECLQLLNDVHEQFGKQLTYQTLASILVYKIICKHHLQLIYEDELQKLRTLEHFFNHEKYSHRYIKRMKLISLDYRKPKRLQQKIKDSSNMTRCYLPFRDKKAKYFSILRKSNRKRISLLKIYETIQNDFNSKYKKSRIVATRGNLTRRYVPFRDKKAKNFSILRKFYI